MNHDGTVIHEPGCGDLGKKVYFFDPRSPQVQKGSELQLTFTRFNVYGGEQDTNVCRVTGDFFVINVRRPIPGTTGAFNSFPPGIVRKRNELTEEPRRHSGTTRRNTIPGKSTSSVLSPLPARSSSTRNWIPSGSRGGAMSILFSEKETDGS